MSRPLHTTRPHASPPALRIHLDVTDTNQIDIRHATSTDQDALAVLYAEARLGDSSDPIAAKFDVDTLVRKYLEHESSRLWVAEIGDSGPVGMIGLWPTDTHTAELRHLRVSKDHRSKGIGRVLVEHAVDECRKRDMLKVTLDTYVERKPAVALFEKLGFQLAGTRSIDDKEVYDFYLNLYNDESDFGHEAPPM